jgi:N-acetylglucosamine kinase-like BadF-type ATPase
MAYLLGLDAGGTKIEWALADPTGAVVARAVSAGANLRRVNRKQLAELLARGFEELRMQAALGEPEFEIVCAGFAGAGDESARAMARDVLHELFRPQHLYVVGDMEVALEAAVGAGPGVVLIAGTGSIAYGRNLAGRTARAGGKGPFVAGGDAGSAFDIARRAGAHGDSPEEVSALVPEVVARARSGDADARQILHQAGTELARLAARVLDQLELMDTEMRVATVGGVFVTSDEVYESVRAELAPAAPRARLERLRVSPAEGAVRLGCRLREQELGPRS